MRRLALASCGFVILATVLIAPQLSAAQRRRVIVRRPVARTGLVVRRGHPIRRALPGAVVVRAPRRPVIVKAPLVYAPTLTWTPTVASVPPSTRLVWQDSETITRDEEWVDTNFGIDAAGNALFLHINGTARFSFAELTFANGNVQVVDFNEVTHGSGVYKLLDFADGRHVSTVRLLARSESDETKLTVYLSRG